MGRSQGKYSLEATHGGGAYGETHANRLSHSFSLTLISASKDTVHCHSSVDEDYEVIL